jgi:hypothetical protein
LQLQVAKCGGCLLLLLMLLLLLFTWRADKMIITHPYQIERHSLGGRNAFPTIPINPKPGHIPYHKGLGFIGILEWDSDDRFCHLTIYLKPYQITKYGGGMHAPMHHFVFG